ncbi:MAG: hypothetical protein KDB03_21335 [Planctomycetales bacterium]|nr:hypothetical protein [Planctomycetales bacterium]
MKNFAFPLIAFFACCMNVGTLHADSPFGRIFGRFSGGSESSINTTAWHGQYNYTPAGAPVALVVPPRAVMQQTYAWGVAQNRMVPITNQFGAYPGGTGGSFLSTPRWPSHTDQFGVYSVRAPW